LRRNSKHGERYAKDLLNWVNIPLKDNDALIAEMGDLFGSHSEENIEEVYQEIMFLCELPNGQMRGKLPPLYEIKKILDANKKNKVGLPKTFKDYAMVCPQCGSAFSMEQYRCLGGYIVRSIGGGYTAAVPCRDKKDSSVGPLLKKEKLESIPKEFLKK